MIKKTKNISINILVVLFVLLSLLCISVGVGHAWFTTNQNRGVQVVVRVNEYNLVLYQVTNNSETESSKVDYTYKKNDREGSSNYIVLKDALLADEFNDLKLKVKNEDAGAGVYIKYQIKLFALTANAKTEIPIDVTLGENFELKNNYFYYVDTSSANKLLSNSNEVILLTGFTVPYSSFESFQGGETVMLELTIECCETNTNF